LKKSVLVLLIGASLFFPVVQGNARELNSGVSLRLSFAMGNTSVGDMSGFINSMNGILLKTAKLSNYTTSGKLENVNLGPEFGGELVLKLSRNFGIGVGFTYLTRNRESAIEIKSLASNKTGLIRYDANYKAYPVTVSGYYYIPIGKNLNAFVSAGVGYYFAKIETAITEEIADGGNTSLGAQSEMKANDQGLGFHGSMGLEYKLSKSISLFFEGSGRLAEFKDWEGEVKFSKNDIVKGSLWYVGADAKYFKDYYGLEFADRKPQGKNIKSARKAEINFSGFSLKIGIKIGFGKK